RVWEIAWPELLPDIRPGIHVLRPVALSDGRFQKRVSRPLRDERTQAAHAALSPGGSRRPYLRFGYQEARERRPAGDAAGMDTVQRSDAFQNQTQRRRPELGHRSRFERRSMSQFRSSPLSLILKCVRPLYRIHSGSVSGRPSFTRFKIKLN